VGTRPEGADSAWSGGSENTPIKSLQRQLENREQIIGRLKQRQGKKIERATQETAEEAVSIYKAEQTRLNRTTRLFEKVGYPGLAQDYLALNPDGEPSPDAVEGFLAQRGLEPNPNEPEPAFTRPPAAASFHAGGGGTAGGTGPMTWAECSRSPN
jgi:hypothetical protein